MYDCFVFCTLSFILLQRCAVYYHHDFQSVCSLLYLPLLLLLSPCSKMLSNRPCYDCGRQVRLSATIQPPRCPACRLSFLSPMLETRPCLRCYVPILISSSGVRCARCEAVLSLDVSYSPYYDCRIPFPARPSVMRCFNCRSRRTNVVQRPVNFRLSYGTSFDLTMNSFE